MRSTRRRFARAGRRLTAPVLATCFLALTSCGRGFGRANATDDAETLRSAMQGLTGVMVYDILSPPQSARAYAYASVAAYEAMRPNYPAYRTLAGQLNGLKPLPAPPGPIAPAAAGVHALLTVGRALTFSRPRVDSLRTANDAVYQAALPADVYARSIAYGDTIAARVLAWAGTDQYLQTRGAPKFAVTTTPGRWVPTPPGYFDAVEPHWGELRPFALDSAGQFSPPPPPAFDTAAASPFMREVREVYTVGQSLTPEQRAIAGFWDCNPYTMHVTGHNMFATKKISPGGHWMSVVGLVTRQAHADVMRTATAYARTALALDDAFIVAWKEKFRSNLIRPETVINTYVDPEWTPTLQTPPFPEYISGHSVISMAAARVLTDEFGPRFAYVDSSERAYGLPPRAFPSFEAAAQEAAISRLYGGIHYRRAIEAGAALGRQVGDLEVARVRPRGAAPATAPVQTAAQ